MGSLANYAENALLGHIFGTAYSAPASIYIALSTADPLDDASGLTEPGDTYARQTIAFLAAASRAVVQDAEVIFPEAAASWGTITHWALFDAASGGNMLAHGSFLSSFDVLAGNSTTIGSGEVQVSINASAGAGFTDYLAHALLDLMFNGVALSQPDTYVALANATISDAATSITEVTGTGYSRVLTNKAGQAAPAWSAVASGAVDNADAIDWSVGAGDWLQIVAMALMDATTAGNVLAYDNANIVDQTPANGDTVKFDVGALNVSLS